MTPRRSRIRDTHLKRTGSIAKINKETVMKQKLFGMATMAILVFGLAAATNADIKITTKNSAAGHSYEGTTYIKGQRERTEGLGGLIMIYQCDMKRYVQLYSSSKKYMMTVINEGADATDRPQPEARRQPEAQPQPQSATRKGGVVTFTTTMTDTGERKKMFGFTARHIKTSMTKEASPDACDPKPTSIETDGWYIDLQYGFHCSTDKPAIPTAPGGPRARPECQDQIKFKIVGGGRLGYPLDVTTTVHTDNGQTFTTSTQVTDLSTTTLDTALFDVPDGYTEAKSYQELMGVPSIDITSRRRGGDGTDAQLGPPAGDIKMPRGARVGVVMVTNKTDSTLATDSLQSHLVSSISSGTVEAVPLTASSPDSVRAEAKQKQCDYVLYTDVSEVKKPSTAGRIGSIISRKSGSMGKYEANLKYRLFPIGDARPLLQSDSSGQEDGSAEAAVSSALDGEARMVLSAVRKR
jgi:hypothetical protein